MLEGLLQLDAQWLLWVEQNIRTPWLHTPMYVMSHLKFFVPILIALFTWLIWKGDKKGKRAALAALALFIVTNQLTNEVLKPLIGRPRPHSASFSFPSTHAVNIFGQATLFSIYYPWMSPILIPSATLVGFSRIYGGFHYPLDVIGGAIIGSFLGLLAWYLSRRYAAYLDRCGRRCGECIAKLKNRLRFKLHS